MMTVKMSQWSLKFIVCKWRYIRLEKVRFVWTEILTSRLPNIFNIKRLLQPFLNVFTWQALVSKGQNLTPKDLFLKYLKFTETRDLNCCF